MFLPFQRITAFILSNCRVGARITLYRLPTTLLPIPTSLSLSCTYKCSVASSFSSKTWTEYQRQKQEEAASERLNHCSSISKRQGDLIRQKRLKEKNPYHHHSLVLWVSESINGSTGSDKTALVSISDWLVLLPSPFLHLPGLQKKETEQPWPNSSWPRLGKSCGIFQAKCNSVFSTQLWFLFILVSKHKRKTSASKA